MVLLCPAGAEVHLVPAGDMVVLVLTSPSGSRRLSVSLAVSRKEIPPDKLVFLHARVLPSLEAVKSVPSPLISRSSLAVAGSQKRMTPLLPVISVLPSRE